MNIQVGGEAEPAQIHPLAVVHDDCVVGPRTRIWPFASIIRGSRVGAGCVVAAGVTIDGAKVGSGCSVSHGAFVCPGVVIEDDVFIGPGVLFCNDFWPSVKKIGWFDLKDLISGKVVVTEVGRGANIGAGSVILPGVVVGDGAMIAAGSVVSVDVPPRFLYRSSGNVQGIDPTRVPHRNQFVRDYR